MAKAGFESGSAPYLNANEQNLLLNALKSNQPNSAKDESNVNADVSSIDSQADESIFESLNDPSFLSDHFDSTNFSWDLDPAALANAPTDNANGSINSADAEDASPTDQTGDKRKDRDDDDSEKSVDGGNKRREGEEKTAKKPGRKPLTNEPTSKRKAQNRAAQRAFRERKEKHLRDLEQKVEDLEKASEATNHENGVLRAQVDRLNAEVSEYKKQLGTARQSSFSASTQPVSKMNWDIGQSFDFEFPKFGVDGGSGSGTGNKLSECVDALNKLEKRDAERDFFRSNSSFSWSPAPLTSARSMSTATSGVSPNYFDSTQSPLSTVRSPTTNTDKSVANSESPASLGLSSSVCTTPEATVDSPGNFKTGGKKNSISHSDFRASTSPGQPKTPSQDNSQNLDWFANQNNGLFDPILIDAYREPQDNILNHADLNLSFFDDAFPWNPASNNPTPFPMSGAYEGGAGSKKSLLDKVEQAAEGKQHDSFSAVVTTTNENGYVRQITCAKLWDRVQRSEKVLNGEADMDDLCSQLKAKAKCGGPTRGAVVDERDVDAILGPDPAGKKTAAGVYGMFK